MLQELAASTGATAWAIASMLFFLGVYVVLAARVFRARSEEMDAHARLALEGDPPSQTVLRGTSSETGGDGPGSNEG